MRTPFKILGGLILIAFAFAIWGHIESERTKETHSVGNATKARPAEKIIVLTPEEEKIIDTHYKVGVAHYQKGEYQKAVEQFNKAIELGRRDADIYFQRGKAHFNNRGIFRSSYAEARKDFERSIQLNPKNAEAYFWCAKACVEDGGRYDEAIARCRKAAELNPNGTGEYFAWCAKELVKGSEDRYRKKRYDEAITLCNKATQLDPSNAYAYGWRGKAYFQKSQHDIARRELDKAVELDSRIERDWFSKDADVKLMLEVFRGQ